MLPIRTYFAPRDRRFFRRAFAGKAPRPTESAQHRAPRITCGIVQARALRWLTLTLALTLSTLSAETLESNNPFLPPGYGQEAPVQKVEPVVQNGPVSREIEFRGIVQLDGVYQFSVYNKSDQKGYWLRENESEDGISIRGYDANTQSITLSLNGRSERLTLMSESDAPLPVTASVSVPQPTVNSNQAPTLPPNLGNNRNNNDSDNRRRVIPRRRVILPKK